MDSSLLLMIWFKISILLVVFLSIAYALPWTSIFKFKSFKKMLCYSLLALICLVNFMFMMIFTWNYMGMC